MAVTGSRSETVESKEYTKKIGFVQAEIVLVCPKSNEEIEEAGFNVYKPKDGDAKEPDYVSEKEVEIGGKTEEVTQVRVVFYLKDANTGEPIRSKTFYILDHELESKNNPGSFQWINEQGNTTYAKDKDSIASWFTMNGQLQVRKAKRGEQALYEFIRASYNLKWNDKENIARCLVNIKDLLKGKFKELQSDVEATAGTVIVPVIIKTKDFDGETKEIEDIYNAFAPGAEYKFLQTKKEFSDKDVESIRKKDDENAKTPKGIKKPHYLSNLERMILSITDPNYGCKDTYFLGLAKDYDKDEYLVTSSNSGNLGGSSKDVDDY